MAIDDKRQSKYELEAEDTIAVLASLKDTSKRLDDTMKLGEKLLKDSSSIINNAVGNIQDVMTFSSKSLSDTFKFSNILEKSREKEFLNYMKIEAQLDADRKNLSKSIEEIDDAISAMKLAAENAGEVVDQSKLNNLEQLKGIEEQKLRQINSTNAVQMHQINSQKALFNRVVKLATGAIDTIIGVYTQAFSSAYNKVSSTWESTFGDVTSMNNYSKAEYTKIIDSMTKYLKDTGLDKSISLTDYQNKLVDILKSGLTGELAETVSRYALLSEEGGISANFSDVSMVKFVNMLNKEGQDVESFLSDITVQSKSVIDEMGNALGFSDGQINTMVDSMYRLASVVKFTDEGLSNTVTSMTAFNGALGDTEFDVNKLYNDVTEYAVSGLKTANSSSLLSFSNLGSSADVRKLIETEGMETVLKRAMQGIYEQYGNARNADGTINGEFLDSINTALGGSHTTEELTNLFKNAETYDEFEKQFNIAKAAAEKANEKDYINGLERFQTEQEKLANSAETEVAELVKIAKSNVVVEGLVDKGVGLLTSINTQMLYNTGKGLFSDLKGAFGKGAFGKGAKLSNLFGGSGGVLNNAKAATDLFKSGATFKDVAAVGGKGTAVLGKAGQLFSNGTAFASKGGTLAKVGSKVFSTGGKALGVAGSLVSMGLDAYSGYKEDGMQGALRGAITGSGKAAESGWDVAKGAGSGALKGAGIGMVFGPLGAAIGAAVGGLAGLAVGLHDLNDEQKKFESSLKKLNVTAAELEKTESIRKNSINEISSLEDLYQGALKGNKDSINALNKKYPILNEYMGTSGEVTDEYASVLRDVIKLEQQKLAGTSLGTYNTAYNIEGGEIRAGDIWKDSGKSGTAATTATNLNNAKSNLDAARKVKNFKYSGEKITFDDKAENYDPYNDILKIAKENGIDLLAAGINTSSGGQVTAWADKVGILDADEAIAHTNEYSLKITGYKYSKEDYNRDSTAMNKAVTDTINTEQSKYDKSLETIRLWYKNVIEPKDYKLYINSFDSWAEVLTQNSNAKATFDRSAAMINALNKNSKYFELATGKTWEDFKSSYGEYTPKALYTKFNEDANFGYTPAFAVGLDYVPYDNFYARLHKGERIQTAAEANLDRASLKVNSSSMAESLKSSLVYQTDIIIDILRKIYISVSGSSATSISSNMNISLPSNAT